MNDLDADLIAVFRDEAKDLFDRLTRGLLELEMSDAPDRLAATLAEIFRCVHTLKGAASSVGREDLAQVAHVLEDCLELVRSEEMAPGRAVIDAALVAIDVMGSGLEQRLSNAESQRAIQGLQGLTSAASKSGSTSPTPLTPPRPPARRGKRKSAPAKTSAAPGTPKARPDTPEPGMLKLAAPEPAMLGPATPEPAMLEPAMLEPTAPLNDRLRSAPAEGWIRMPVALLDSVMYRLDELVAVKLRLDYLRRQVELVQAAADYSGARQQNGGGSSSEVNLQSRRLEPIRRELAHEVHVLGLLAQGLQEEVKEVRMVPAGPILDPLRRVVRETANAIGKEAALETRGEDVRVDKRHLDLMREPLMHLVRNAVGHGIESPDERRAAGKPSRGKVEISVDAGDAELCIEVRDDGRGIHRDQLLAVAVKRGVVDSKRGAELTDEEVLNLIFLPGFSTSSQVTELSGRGVGMDVVRENVERAGGRIDSHSEPGRGTQFKLILPLTVASSRGLMVWAGKEPYCLPLMLVDEVVAVEPSAVGVARGQLAIQWRSQAVAFVSLSDLLARRPSARPTSRCFAVVLALADRHLAVGVDQLLGEEEIVVKGLAPGTPKLPFVAGATNRSDGRLVTVLELTAIAKAAAASSSQPIQAVAPLESAPTILVVDDTLTTRTMISLLLERSGYRTLVAANGEEALAMLDGKHVDVLVADVEMPVLNGLELVRRVRSSSQHSALPVILLTSLDSPVDRARGAEAGANSYVVKSMFEPATFLSMVSDFVGRRGAA